MRFYKIILMAIVLLAGFPALAKGPDLPDYTGFVNDFAGVIDADSRGKLEGLCRALEKKTSAELAIVTVKSVEPLDSKEYAVRLFEKWKIGKKGKDNGVLMLLALEERRIEIEVGYGLEGVINDAKAGEVLDKYVVPYFKQGEFAAGLANGANALAGMIARASQQELGDEYKATTPDTGISAWNILLMVMAGIALFIVLVIFLPNLAIGLVGGVTGGMIGFIISGMLGVLVGAAIGFVILYVLLYILPSGGSGWGSGGGDFTGGSFGSGGSSSGGGFGGFGGGGSGGGGAGRSW
jgi:uncharacterized protein